MTSSGIPAPDVAVMHCAQCGWAVQEGPRGGYVCAQCFHTVEPPAAARADAGPAPLPGPGAPPDRDVTA
ncbi:hypothetical protein GCM10010420_33560 [Streptomyces glaucosporus]|uniref:Uncharacterized protein n=2 Tax=Streptomyces glaucosporus TaxID=284044 RepID=A0ABN3IGI3_9ACTN